MFNGRPFAQHLESGNHGKFHGYLMGSIPFTWFDRILTFVWELHGVAVAIFDVVHRQMARHQTHIYIYMIYDSSTLCDALLCSWNDSMMFGRHYLNELRFLVCTLLTTHLGVQTSHVAAQSEELLQNIVLHLGQMKLTRSAEASPLCGLDVGLEIGAAEQRTGQKGQTIVHTSKISRRISQFRCSTVKSIQKRSVPWFVNTRCCVMIEDLWNKRRAWSVAGVDHRPKGVRKHKSQGLERLRQRDLQRDFGESLS